MVAETKTCVCCTESLPITEFRVRGDKACYYADSHCIPCRRMKDNQQRLIRLGRASAPEVVIDRSYTPPMPEQFLPLPPPLERVALVWRIAA